MRRRQFITTSSVAFATTLLPSCTEQMKTLRVFIWADYLSEDATASFENKHGCKLVIDTFDSNEAMLAKLELGATEYDVLVSSSYVVKDLQAKQLLQELYHSKLPNIKNVDAKYLEYALDPEMKVSIPYMLKQTCLAYLRTKVTDGEPSWSLLDRADLKGRITLLDDMREVLGAALISLGFSMNSTEPSELEEAVKVVIRWKANIAKFESEQYKTGIASGDFYLVHGYAGELLAVRDENGEIEVIIPQEGAAFSCDDLCIPKTSKNVELAHSFINHLCDAEVAAQNMECIGYRAPNSAAYKMLTEDFRSSEILFPPDEIFAKCKPISYLGDKLALWKSAWEQVKHA